MLEALTQLIAGQEPAAPPAVLALEDGAFAMAVTAKPVARGGTILKATSTSAGKSDDWGAGFRDR